MGSKVDNGKSNATASSVGIVNGIDKLSREITCQRRLLRSSELEMFDQQWGIDPSEVCYW